MGFHSYFPELGESRPTGSAASFEMKGEVLAFKLQPETVSAIRTNFNPGTMEDWLTTTREQFDKDDSDGTKLAECKSNYFSPTTGVLGISRTKQVGDKLVKKVNFNASGKMSVVDASIPSKAKNNEKLKEQSIVSIKTNKAYHKLGKKVSRR